MRAAIWSLALAVSAASFSVDDAASQSLREPSEFIECINRANGHLDGIDLEREWDDSFASGMVIDENGPIVQIHGRIGWHVTWAALIDFSGSPVFAFETFGAEGSMTRAFGRHPLNEAMIASFEHCGVPFGGLWNGPIPQRQHFADRESAPVLSTGEGSWEWPAMDDLLPPPRE